MERLIQLSWILRLALLTMAVSDDFRLSKPRDCGDIQLIVNGISGVYKIFPVGTAGFGAYCDMDTAGGGWTVIQRRVNGSVDFYRNWTDYLRGFGDVDHEFWLGNLAIHAIVSQGLYELRIDMISPKDEMKFAGYAWFTIGDISTSFKLSVDGFYGDAGDSLSYHNGMKFSTKDRDNDAYDNKCAVAYTGGWWYRKCHHSNVNGQFGSTEYGKGLNWRTVTGKDDRESLKSVEMKVRKIARGGY